jgi:hypothetical protein
MVVNIELEFMPKMRGLRGLAPEERKIKIQEMTETQKAELKTALKVDKVVDKVVQYQEQQRKERMERMKFGD